MTINTSSPARLQGSIGQGNYAAAKAGIAELTIQAKEIGSVVAGLLAKAETPVPVYGA